MIAPPDSHIARELFVDYFVGELGPEDATRIEDHVFECGDCASQFERAGALASSLRSVIPPVITHEKVDRLRKTGCSMKRVVVAPGARIDAVFEKQLGLLIFALQGELESGERVDLEISAEDGSPLGEISGVPVDRDTGELLIACQRHYSESFPALIRFRTWAIKGDARRPVGEYVINHIFE